MGGCELDTFRRWRSWLYTHADSLRRRLRLAREARSRTVQRMTESTYRMRLLSVHPLDAPVVALAASMTAPEASARPGGRGRLTAVGAVKCHGSRELDTFHAADAGAMVALAGFADGSLIVAHGLADALGEDARRR